MAAAQTENRTVVMSVRTAVAVVLFLLAATGAAYAKLSSIEADIAAAKRDTTEEATVRSFADELHKQRQDHLERGLDKLDAKLDAILDRLPPKAP